MAVPSPLLLESAPSPWLLPILLFLIAVEVGFIVGRRWFSEPLASQVSSLAVRKYELLMSIKMLGVPADFVKKSKLERELIAVEKDLGPKKVELTEKVAVYDSIIQKTKLGLKLVLVLLFWSTPLITFTRSATWPLSPVLSAIRFPPGVISALGCITLVQAAIHPFRHVLGD